MENDHSLRRATFGSTRAARIAGIRLASVATTSSTATTSPNTSGSRGLHVEEQGAPTFPRTARSRCRSPPRDRERNPSPSTSWTTSCTWAPNATRTPISCVRCVDVVRDHAVKADRREHQREHPERHEHRRAQSPRPIVRPADLGHRPNVTYDDPGIIGCSARRTRSALRAASPFTRTNNPPCVGADLIHRAVVVVLVVVVELLAAADVLGDADDLGAGPCPRRPSRTGRCASCVGPEVFAMASLTTMTLGASFVSSSRGCCVPARSRPHRPEVFRRRR